MAEYSGTERLVVAELGDGDFYWQSFQPGYRCDQC